MAFRFLAYNKSIVVVRKGSHSGTCYTESTIFWQHCDKEVREIFTSNRALHYVKGIKVFGGQARYKVLPYRLI